MAYLHCHGCNWEQDDFWSLKYNPVQTLFSYIRDFKLWRPRVLKFDRYAMPPTGEIHSYRFLGMQLGRMWRNFHNMEWWTYQEYCNARSQKTAICPKCGKAGLCID